MMENNELANLENVSQDELLKTVKSLQTRIKNLSSLFDLSAIINSTLDLDELLNIVMETAKEVVGAEASSLMLIDYEANELVYQVAQGEVGDKVREQFRIKIGQGISGWVAQKGEPLLVPDAYNDPRFYTKVDEDTGFRTRNILCVPLKVKDKIIGVTQVINKVSPGGEPLDFTDEDVQLLVTFGNQAAVAIESARLHKSLMEKQRLERDLEVASELQQSFLPQRFPKVPHFSFAGKNVPAMDIGGDLYDVFNLPNKKVGLTIGDVSGKGISAALYMARLISDIRHLAPALPNPDALLNAIDKELSDRSRRGMFVTLIYGVLDPVTKIFTFANAGHHPFGLKRDNNLEFVLGDNGPPLGILGNSQYKSATVNLKSGDTLLFYTDGITEARKNAEEMYGKERLENVFKASNQTGMNLIKEILASVHRFTGGKYQSDDLTLLTVSVNGV